MSVSRTPARGSGERLLTVREVATWIGVDPHTLHRWRWDGLGPRHLRAGRGIRYRASDVQIWLTRERDE